MQACNNNNRVHELTASSIKCIGAIIIGYLLAPLLRLFLKLLLRMRFLWALRLAPRLDGIAIGQTRWGKQSAPDAIFNVY